MGTEVSAAGEPAPPSGELQGAGEPSLIQRAAGSAGRLFARFGLITIIGGITTVALTRVFGPRDYGAYASGIATWSLLGAIADFGLTPMLSRDTARRIDPPSPDTYRSAYLLGTVWCTALSAIQVALAVSAGVSSTRGTILLILVPAMLFNALNPARTVFVVTYRTGTLLTVDAVGAVIQSAITLLFLALGFGPVVTAIIVSAGSILNNLAVLHYSNRVLADIVDPGYDLRAVARRAAPLAILSVLVQVYFTIDLVLLGWLVHGQRLGDYAAASKLLQLLAGISGVVVSGSLPALAATARDGGDLGAMLARMWHWLLVVIMPAFVTLAVASAIVVKVMFGDSYSHAVPLLRILCAAGMVSPLVNIAASVQVAMQKTRAMFTQNVCAAVLNVGGNLVLVPIVGVVAAAWLTFGTDVLVGGLALYSLRGSVSFRPAVSISSRPLMALAVMVACELVLLPISAWLSAGAGIVAFIIAATVLGSWPEEFAAIGRRLSARRRAPQQPPDQVGYPAA